MVDALGEDVQDVQVGDEVLGWADTGSYAEYALATTVAPKPAGLDWQHAAALPVASETAERVLDLLGVTEGETVLMHGAAGAVGTLAVQLAAARGARVIATAGPANQDYLAALGATPTVYGEGLVERVRALAPDGVDAVFDLAGKGALEDSITLRGGTERIVTIADFGARQLGITFSSGRQERSAARLAALAQDAATGKVVTTVTAYPLDQAATAQQVSDAGHVPRQARPHCRLSKGAAFYAVGAVGHRPPRRHRQRNRTMPDLEPRTPHHGRRRTDELRDLPARPRAPRPRRRHAPRDGPASRDRNCC